MKKIRILLVVVIVLIAAWLGVAWYTGTRIQAKVGDSVGRANAAWAKNPRAMGVQIKQLDYERGLFTSHARFAITNGPLGNDALELGVTFSHGPFPLAALRHGDFSPQKVQAHIEALATTGPLKTIADALMNDKPLVVLDIGCNYGSLCSGTGSVPPIDDNLGALFKNAKLTFGGIQIRLDTNCDFNTDCVYKADGQLLSLSIGGQNLGSGQITVTTDPVSANGMVAWKTDQGASKFTVALGLTQAVPLLDSSFVPEDLPKLIKTVSAKLELSKPMVADLLSRASSTSNLAQGIDLDTARKQAGLQLDSLLDKNYPLNQDAPPPATLLFQTQGDLFVSDWHYADGKLTINGQNNPAMLEQIKQGYLAQAQAKEQALHAGQEAVPAAPPASAPMQAASGR